MLLLHEGISFTIQDQELNAYFSRVLIRKSAEVTNIILIKEIRLEKDFDPMVNHILQKLLDRVEWSSGHSKKEDTEIVCVWP